METKGSLALNSQAFRISGDLRPCHCTKASLNPRRAENCILDIVTSVINKIDRLCSWPFAFTVLASTRASSFDIVSPTSHNPYSLLPPSSNPPQFAPSNVVHHQRGESLPSPQAQSPRRGWSRRYKHKTFSHPPLPAPYPRHLYIQSLSLKRKTSTDNLPSSQHSAPFNTWGSTPTCRTAKSKPPVSPTSRNASAPPAARTIIRRARGRRWANRTIRRGIRSRGI